MSKKLINKRAFSLTHARSARSQRQKPVIRLASRMKSPPLPALKSFDLSSPIDRRQNSSYITPRKQNSTFTYDTFRSQSRGRKGANSYSTNTTTFYNTFDCQSSEIADGLDIFQVKRLYDAKCDDIGLVKLPDQQARFIEYCRKHFKNRKFKLVKHGLGPKSSRVITEILHNNVNFGYLILAQNNIGDKGIQAMIRQLRKNRALVHLDISNNDITQEGAKLLFEMMTHHQSIIHLDVSSRDGLRRNRLGEIGSEPIGEVLR